MQTYKEIQFVIDEEKKLLAQIESAISKAYFERDMQVRWIKRLEAKRDAAGSNRHLIFDAVMLRMRENVSSAVLGDRRLMEILRDTDEPQKTIVQICEIITHGDREVNVRIDGKYVTVTGDKE